MIPLFQILLFFVLLLLIITIYIGATMLTAIETLTQSVTNLEAAVAALNVPANNDAAILAQSQRIDAAVAVLQSKTV